jgi:hypothetical protein
MRLHAATAIRGLGHVQIYFKENSPTAISSPGVLKSLLGKFANRDERSSFNSPLQGGAAAVG